MNGETPLDARLRELASAALQQTRAGQMAWRPTDDDDAFLFSGTSTSLVIDFYPFEGRYELRVLNSRGAVVESVSGQRGMADPWGVGGILADLHDAARRVALDIDTFLDAAMQDVLGVNRPGTEPPF